MSGQNIWTKKLIEYNNTKEAGQCPVCGSSQFKVEVFEYGRTSILFKCPDCGATKHFDGLIKKA